MNAIVETCPSNPALETLQRLDAGIAAMDRADLARQLLPVVRRLEGGVDKAELAVLAPECLRVLRLLHPCARSREALPLARALLAQARACGDRLLERYASSACGIFCADVGDPVGAIQHQVDALRLAGDDRISASRAWNNIGLAMQVAGHSALAVRCYERALNAVEGVANAADVRYGALSNLAQSQFDTAAYDEGLVSASLALASENPALSQRDPMMVLRLRRNLVRLLVAVGRVEDAEPHVLDAIHLAERVRTPRAMIAASLARAVYDLAVGDADVGLTRLDAALAASREVPGALRDTLGLVVRAEEMAGHSERALLRLNELSDVVYGSAVAAARQHIELASLADREQGAQEERQARARLISKLREPQRPDGWSALERMAITASVRVEPTGLHGKRVAALAKALAMASGSDPLQALEIGFACELHDIGMITVPEELLATPRSRPELERDIVERHVRAGVEILSDDAHPRIFLAREVVRYHHAHWDGSGHPQQVENTRIPAAARICAIADAYDDLVCGSRATKRQSMERALGHLRAQAGHKYDPELVERFETMIRAESDDLGLDIAAHAGMDNFQQLVSALQEDRGFV
jgi:response regulator RpfG family c-di-GMP phosphodiesterase